MDQYYSQLVAKLEPYFTINAPFQLPENIQQLIVKIAPWLALIGVIFGAIAFFPIMLGLLGLSVLVGILSPWATLMAWVGVVFLGLQIVLMAMSFPGLKNITEPGWKYAFYGAVLSVIYGLFNWLQAPLEHLGGLIGTAIGAYISFFLLFQVRHHYTGIKKAPVATQTASTSV